RASRLTHDAHAHEPVLSLHCSAAERRGHLHGFGRIRVAAAKAEHDAMAALDRLQHERAANSARSAGHHRERGRHSFTNSRRGKFANTSCPDSVTRKQSLSSQPQPSIHIPSMRWKTMFGSITVVSMSRRLAVWSAQLGG